MTTGERILNAVCPQKAVKGLTDAELALLCVELKQRAWFNAFWDLILTLCYAEIAIRFCAVENIRAIAATQSIHMERAPEVE